MSPVSSSPSQSPDGDQPLSRELVDPVMAESYGRCILGSEPWPEVVFRYTDGCDGTSRGYLMPAEFAMLASRLGQELGKAPYGRKFAFDFRDADADNDGRVSCNEWVTYAQYTVEEIYGHVRCKRAALRFLGARKAERRCRTLVGGAHMYITSGYHPKASLRLVRTCTKWKDLALVQRVQSALKQRADPNCGLADPQFNGYTPLIFLAMAGATKAPHVGKAIHLLIEAKADAHRECEAMPFGTWVPLRFAAQLQSVASVDALLRHVNVGERFCWAAGENVQHVMLDEMRQYCSPEICSRIAANTKFDNRATVLMQLFASSIVGGNLTKEGAKKLIDGDFFDNGVLDEGSRADPNGAGLEGVTALMNVVIKGDLATTKELLRGRANPMQVDSSGATPLHLAASRVRVDIMRALLEARGEPHAMDHAGFSPWMLVGEMCSFVSNEERSRIQEMLQMLQPGMPAEQVVDLAESGWDALIANGDSSMEGLTRRLRLAESLFFDQRSVRRGAHEGRVVREHLVLKLAGVLVSLLRTDPLKGEKKNLAKYFLHATMGPICTVDCAHVRVPWQATDNRASYRQPMTDAVQEMLGRFADECDAMCKDIEDCAAGESEGPCAALLKLPPDEVTVPEAWRREPFWHMVHERQLLRYDPPWARDVRDHATCCLALLRLGEVKDLAEYSFAQQVHHSPLEEMMARGYRKYSELCNVAFQSRMKEVAARVAEREGLDIKPPPSVVTSKRLKRLMEKTREAREQHGMTAWPGFPEEYVKFSHCFHILDTVRLSFTCSGRLKSARDVPTAEEVSTTWITNRFPPEREGGSPGSFPSDADCAFANVACLDHGATGYLGPDCRGTKYACGGDPNSFFVLDLGEECFVEKLEVINAWHEPEKYFLCDYEIAIGNDITDFKFKPGVFPEVSTTKLQSVRVNASGRYIRMNMTTYGPHGVAISYLNVVTFDDEARMERQRGQIEEQVMSCMRLVDEMRTLTLEQDGLCLLRQKSGFSSKAACSGGYKDVKLLILADLGTHKAFDDTELPLRIVGEVQLILKGYQAVKDRMHLVYEVARGSFN